jgi:hypothetical protein
MEWTSPWFVLYIAALGPVRLLRVDGVDRGMEPRRLLRLAMVQRKGRQRQGMAEQMRRVPQDMAQAKGPRAATGLHNKLQAGMAPKAQGTVPSKQVPLAMARPSRLRLDMGPLVNKVVSSAMKMSDQSKMTGKSFLPVRLPRLPMAGVEGTA